MLEGSNFSITSEVPGAPDVPLGILVSSGKVLDGQEAISNQFSYYGAHVPENTLLGSGGFNASEVIDGSPFSYNLNEVLWRDGIDVNSFKAQRVVHGTKRIIAQFWASYDQQYGTFAGRYGEDLEAIYGESEKIGGLTEFIPIVVEYLLSNGVERKPYKQTYFVGLDPKDNSRFLQILLGTRNSLYSLFKDLFQVPYPLGTVYQTHDTEEYAREIRENMMTPDALLHPLFQKAIRNKTIRVIEQIGLDCLVEIVKTGKRILMKADGGYQEMD